MFAYNQVPNLSQDISTNPNRIKSDTAVWFILFQVLISWLSVGIKAVGTYFTLFIFLYAAIEGYRKRDTLTIAYAIVYLTGIEIVLRMNMAGIIWEFGKYSSTFLAILGTVIDREKGRKKPLFPILYFVLLIPSILVADYPNYMEGRDRVSFNLAGPLCLCATAYFFYQRKFSAAQYQKLLFFSMLPLIGAATVIYVKLPEAEVIQNYTQLQSNSDFAGGFGPNQVATILGYGFLVVAVGFIQQVNSTSSKPLDLICLTVLLGFSVMTFSRGGVVSAIVAASIALGVSMIHSRNVAQARKYIFYVIMFALSAALVFSIIDNATNGNLTRRYEGTVNKDVNPDGDAYMQNTGMDMSGRDIIIMAEFRAFAENPILGVGPGQSHEYIRKIIGGGLPSHTEFSRLLSEHGSYGLVALLTLAIGTMGKFKNMNTSEKVHFAAFFAISIFTQFHSAMRLAMPSVAFGFALISLDLSPHPLQRK